MKLSAFGEKFAAASGIVELMDDLGAALHDNPDTIFMGGGNPARLPALEARFLEKLEAVLADPERRHRLLGIYQSPRGDRGFRDALAGFLKREYGWAVGPENIAVSNGSQSAFFILYNLFAGQMSDGCQRTIHLPLTPEYLGYADVGLSQRFFTATRPGIDRLPGQMFKYRVDFENLAVDEHTGALCVSRPTNPSGNVLTDDELRQLDRIARDRGVPLIVDGAYGLPFPNICFTDATPMWNDNIVLALSLSKLGMPGVRTGILVANEAVIEAYANANTIINLASGSLGPAIARDWFTSGEIKELTREHVTPFYRERARQTVAWFQAALRDLPVHIHVAEGAIFLWLWFEDLPIDSQTLYQRLKARGVLVAPGQGFFIGVDTEDWPHSRQCIRVSYAQDAATVQAGVEIIAAEARAAYADG
ncbi:MAG: valine--pyruvate transaminase [Halieaceae bacterium]|jgi:valine--pyruvate aminotransferase|nr:valine--pyruvate transaminase [Halieaceae bacterium]